MGKYKKPLFSRDFLTLFLIAMLFYGCAAMQSPEGGPRDETPPKVLKMTPENLTTNFNAKKITIEFDEYIKLNNEFKEFSISPELERIPELRAKLRRLEITLADSLEDNTTYTLNFGKSIVDLNEANELKNFSYVFSTGPVLDSLSIRGTVTNALTGEAEIESTVFILPLSRDSLFGKKRAPIFTLTDSSGNFSLNNLKKDTYRIYALKEKGGDRIYQQVSDEIGFLKDSLVLDKNIDTVHLSVFKENAPVFRVLDRKLNADGSISLTFNQQLKSPELTVVSPASVDQDKLLQFNKTNDSVSLWLADLSFDSVKVAIKDQGKPLDTVKFTRSKRDTYTRTLNITDNLDGGTLNPFRDLSFSFNLPIKNIDETKILLLEDSIPRNFTLIKDTANILKYHIRYNWRAKEEYILLFRENAATAIFDAKNKEIRRNFTLGDANDYGTLSLTIETPDTTSKSYILEIVNNEKKVISSYPITKKTTVKLSNYRQGIYFGRIVYDTNNNGIWDTGNVSEGLQPEAIWYEPKELSIRANWDREETIKIPLVAPIPKPKPRAPVSSPNTAPSRNQQNNRSNQATEAGNFRRL
jgi:hypothetical protein